MIADAYSYLYPIDVVFHHQTDLINANMFLKYKSSKTIRTRSGFDIVSARIISNLKILLNQMDASTEVDGNTIRFKRLLRRYIPTGENRMKSIKILREGKIQLIKLDESKIKLEWEVKLDSLAFISIMFGVLIGIMLNFALHANPVTVVFFVVLFLISTFVVGRHLIIVQMEDLIETICN